MKTGILTAIALAIVLTISAHAQVPGIINYQGRIVDNGTNFDGTGQFQFALINTDGSATYWSNGVNTVSLTVTKGLYSVLLGDTNVPDMASAIPATVFTNADVRLRVWFNDGVNGVQQLSPDQRIAAVGYALMAGGVPNGSITAAQIAAGAVGSNQIAAGSIGSVAIATGAVTAATIGSGQVVKSVNGLTDAVTLSAGSNVTVTAIGNSLQIAASGGGISTLYVITNSSGASMSFSGSSVTISNGAPGQLTLTSAGGNLVMGSISNLVTASNAAGTTNEYFGIGTNTVRGGGYKGVDIQTYSPNSIDTMWDLNYQVASSAEDFGLNNYVGGGNYNFASYASVNGMDAWVALGTQQVGIWEWRPNFGHVGIQYDIPLTTTVPVADKGLMIDCGVIWTASEGAFDNYSIGNGAVFDQLDVSSTSIHHNYFGVDTNDFGIFIRKGQTAPTSSTSTAQNTDWIRLAVFDTGRWPAIGYVGVASNIDIAGVFFTTGCSSNTTTDGLSSPATDALRIKTNTFVGWWADRNGTLGVSTNAAGILTRDQNNALQASFVSSNATWHISATNDISGNATAMAFQTNIISAINGTFTMGSDRGFVSISAVLGTGASASLMYINGTATNPISSFGAPGTNTFSGHADAGSVLLLTNWTGASVIVLNDGSFTPNRVTYP
ncbi:MAG: hypothetical protein ACLPT4_04735 [Verrucomicrobiia bacterium]